MRPNGPTRLALRHKAVALSARGLSLREIADILSCSFTLVQRAVAKVKAGESVLDRPHTGNSLFLLGCLLMSHRSGRPRKTSEQDDRRATRLIQQDPELSRREALQSAGLEQTISPKTLSRRLHTKGFYCGMKLKKVWCGLQCHAHCPLILQPLLSTKNRKLRIQYARRWLSMSWDKVIFTDEKRFPLRPDRKQRCSLSPFSLPFASHLSFSQGLEKEGRKIATKKFAIDVATWRWCDGLGSLLETFQVCAPYPSHPLSDTLSSGLMGPSMLTSTLGKCCPECSL